MSDVGEIPIEELLQHRSPMLLVRQAQKFWADGVEVMVNTLDSSLFFDENGNVPVWVGIEYMAQTIGVYAGLVARGHGEQPKLGFLLGTRRYTTHIDHFEPNQVLRVIAQEIMRDESNLALFTCKIYMGNQEVADAEIKAIQPDDFAAAMALFKPQSH